MLLVGGDGVGLFCCGASEGRGGADPGIRLVCGCGGLLLGEKIDASILMPPCC